jgi:hypothetical protein
MKTALILAVGLVFCTLSAKAQQTIKVINTTPGEEDARNAAAAEQYSRIDLQAGLVYGFISPLAMMQHVQRVWLAERGFSPDPPPPAALIARNTSAAPPKAGEFFKSAASTESRVSPPPQQDPAVAMNHRDTSHDYNHDGKAFIGSVPTTHAPDPKLQPDFSRLSAGNQKP